MVENDDDVDDDNNEGDDDDDEMTSRTMTAMATKPRNGKR